MGARFLRKFQQQRKRRRFVFGCIAVHRLILRSRRTAKQLAPPPSWAGCYRKHGCQGYA